MRLCVRRLIASGRCLPADKRLTHDQIKSGMEVPTLSTEEAVAHENAVIPHDLAAISVGLIDGDVYTDLDYILDSNADVDMNVIGTSDGMLVEVQGTGEESTYSRAQMDALMDLAEKGLERLDVQGTPPKVQSGARGLERGPREGTTGLDRNRISRVIGGVQSDAQAGQYPPHRFERQVPRKGSGDRCSGGPTGFGYDRNQHGWPRSRHHLRR